MLCDTASKAMEANDAKGLRTAAVRVVVLVTGDTSAPFSLATCRG